METRERLRHWLVVLVAGRAGKLIAGVWSAFGLLTAIRDNFLSAALRAKWDTIAVLGQLPHWSASTWAALSLAVAILIILDGSYRLTKGQKAASANELQDLRSQLYQVLDRTPEIQKVNLLLHQSRVGRFDLLVLVLIHDDTAFRDEWVLDLVLAGGERVSGIRGEIKVHAFNRPTGVYDLTVSFPYGARLPDLKALAGAFIERLSGVDAQRRTLSWPNKDGAGQMPLVPWQDDSLSAKIARSIEGGSGEATRPRIRTEIVERPTRAGLYETGKEWSLRVVNDGDAATVAAFIELVSVVGAPLVHLTGRFPVRWRRDNVVRRTLMRGEDDSLLIGFGNFQHQKGLPEDPTRLWVCYYEKSLDMDSEIWESMYVTTTVNGVTDRQGPDDAYAVVELTITGDPAPADGPYVIRLQFGPRDVKQIGPTALLSSV